jgi:hypothetical protein
LIWIKFALRRAHGWGDRNGRARADLTQVKVRRRRHREVA